MTRWTLALVFLAGCGARDGLAVPGAGPASAAVGVASLAAGYDHTCALFHDGTAMCWGTDSSGQLGDTATITPRTTPAALASPTGILAMSAGYDETCAVLHDGTLECWEAAATPGTGNPGPDVPPTAIAGGVAGVSAGFLYGCAAHTDGTVACWGAGDHGQLGNGATSGFDEPTPTPVLGVSGAVAVAAGEFVTCARLHGGGVSCWGLGPLGDGSTSDSATPVAVQGLGGAATQVVVGLMHACALLADASVWCWGYGGYGELGLGTAVTSAPLPAAVPGLPPARALAACDLHTCALLEDGTVRCWGNDTAYTKGTFTPEPVPGLASAVALASGQSHDCALRGDGRVVCWGDNSSGQLGDGTTTSSATPVEVVGLP